MTPDVFAQHPWFESERGSVSVNLPRLWQTVKKCRLEAIVDMESGEILPENETWANALGSSLSTLSREFLYRVLDDATTLSFIHAVEEATARELFDWQPAHRWSE